MTGVYAAASRANPFRNAGQIEERVGRGEQEAAELAAIAASAAATRVGRVPGVIQTATSGISTARTPLYFVAPASPAAAPAQANAFALRASCARSDSRNVSITRNVAGTSVST